MHLELSSMLQKHQDEIQECFQKYIVHQESLEVLDLSLHSAAQQFKVCSQLPEATTLLTPLRLCGIANSKGDKSEVVCDKSAQDQTTAVNDSSFVVISDLESNVSTFTAELLERRGADSVGLKSMRNFAVKSLSRINAPDQQEKSEGRKASKNQSNFSRSSSEESLGVEARPAQLPTRFTQNFMKSEKGEETEPSPEKKPALVKKRTSQRLPLSPLAKRRSEMLEAKMNFFERATRSKYYEIVNAVFIVLNSLFICWETDHRARLVADGASDSDIRKDQLLFNVGADIFCVIFTGDLLIRLVAERWHFFFSRERLWNIFDIVVVATAIAETIVHWCQYAQFAGSLSGLSAFIGKFSMLRIVRLLRVVREARAIREARFVRELRMMVYSMMGAMKSFAWSIVLALIILMIFGVFLTDGAVAHVEKNSSRQDGSNGSGVDARIQKYFGTLFPDGSTDKQDVKHGAIVSLYLAMSGGVDWVELLEALQPLSFEYRTALLIFVTFAIFALLNVVTAVFVETAMQRSQNDREMLVQQEMENKAEFVATMQQVFEELDTNNSGTLSKEEFEKQIQDENIMAYLSTLELDIDQVRTLLTLLDLDQNGEVDIEEFVSGCLRLKGEAKSLDMAILQYQVEYILHNLSSLNRLLEKRFFDTSSLGDCSPEDSPLPPSPPLAPRAAAAPLEALSPMSPMSPTLLPRFNTSRTGRTVN
mmetsp:Transcript_86770/g.165838  ORF Transcript_86770/g.165838 Transcript_86770/m.165838 type:complete len:706 (+) Transcript_86770:2-2119(+)